MLIRHTNLINAVLQMQNNGAHPKPGKEHEASHAVVYLSTVRGVIGGT
jgi:hypothetical protein